jgi:hypothetical protein
MSVHSRIADEEKVEDSTSGGLLKNLRLLVYILTLNAGAFLGLIALHRLGMAIGPRDEAVSLARQRRAARLTDISAFERFPFGHVTPFGNRSVKGTKRLRTRSGTGTGS